MTHYWVLSESTHVDQWGSLAGGHGEPQKATVMMIGNVGGGGGVLNFINTSQYKCKCKCKRSRDKKRPV